MFISTIEAKSRGKKHTGPPPGGTDLHLSRFLVFCPVHITITCVAPNIYLNQYLLIELGTYTVTAFHSSLVLGRHRHVAQRKEQLLLDEENANAGSVQG